MEKVINNEAARLIAEDVVYTGGDYDRPSEMLARFKRWQKGEIRASDEHTYPEFTGYYDTYLLQMWRDTSRQNAHYVARGNLETGTVDGGVLYDVAEMSPHQDLSELSREQQRELHYYLETQPLRDFSDLRGAVKLGGKACELYASPDRITLTESDCEQKRVRDLLSLDADVYLIRKSLAQSALREHAA